MNRYKFALAVIAILFVVAVFGWFGLFSFNLTFWLIGGITAVAIFILLAAFGIPQYFLDRLIRACTARHWRVRGHTYRF
jgi:hypothetical protein